MGTPDFAVEPLKKIVESGYEVVAVVTNNDKPVGRKQILTPPPVKVYAQSIGLSVLQYDKIRVEGVNDLKEIAPDLIITCAFGQILSQEIIDIPKLGVINIHASLLPKYRGASPIHYAILNGEKQTGITIMQTDIGIDTGDILLQKPINIGDNETCGQLFEKLSKLGADAIVEALPNIINGKIERVKQDDNLSTTTKIIKKEMALIDWSESATDICNKIRAFNPAPTAFCFYEGQPFKIFEAKVLDFDTKVGKIVRADTEFIIGCGKGALSLLKVQKAGGKPMSIQDFLRGNKFVVGEDFK